METREHWGSRFGCIMATVSSSVGLGTLWKVPYEAGMYGGSAFFIAYIICILCIGLPLLICELSIGHRTQKGPVSAFSALQYPAWRPVGWLSVFASFCIMSYYSVLAGWGLHYFFLSLGKFWEMKTPEEISSMFLHLKGSGSLCLFWHVCFISLATIIISRGVRHGIESWARIGTTLLLGLLIILFLVSTTLPGFHEAASFLLSCDFSNLTQTGLLEALGLSLFTLSLGQGIMITYGSYMKDESIPKTAAFVVGMVIIGSFLSAFSIFPALFTFHISAKSGLGLVFQTLPTFFATLPGAVILCPLFFLLFVCAALGASLGLLEACVATLIDLYHWSRKKAAFTIGFAVGIFGIPSALGGSDSFLKYTRDLLGKPFLEFLDHTVSSWILPLTALGICCFAGYILPKHLFKDEFSKPVFFHLWYFLIRYVVPVSIILVVIHRSGLMHFSS